MPNTEAEPRIITSENTESLNWKEAKQKAAGHPRERPDLTLINC